MQELLSKEWVLKINIWKDDFSFLIKQATLIEIVEFDYYMKKDSNEIVTYIFEILQKSKKWDLNFTEKHFTEIKPDKFKNIFDFILWTYCRWFYNQKETKTKKAKNLSWEAPFSSLLAFIFQNSNETLESIKKCTWEEIQYLSEWIIYNLNEQTPKWKAENAKNQVKKELASGMYDDTLEKLKANRAKVMAKFSKKPIDKNIL